MIPRLDPAVPLLQVFDMQTSLAFYRDVLYFEFHNLDALYAHLTSCGYELEPPANTSYGLRQLSVDDPDGYELCFTAPQKVG